MKQRVTIEDLSEAATTIHNAWHLSAKALGVTCPELRMMADRGSLVYEDLTDEMKEAIKDLPVGKVLK